MKARDVRHLKACDGCGELGTHHTPNGGHVVILTPSGRVLHPRCMSESLLLKCAEAELVTISVADVGADLFDKVVEELIRRRRAEESHG